MRAAAVTLLAVAAAAAAATGDRPSPPPRAASGQKMPLPPGFEQFAQQMFKGVVRANKDVLVQPTFRDAVLGFYHAVDWTEVRARGSRRWRRGSCRQRGRTAVDTWRLAGAVAAARSRAHRALSRPPARPTRSPPLASPQPWIMCLLNLHVAVWIVAVATRTRPNFQIGLFLAICAAVYAAQFLNAYGARHWRALGLTQNYFDDRGVFISFLYSLPLLSAAGFQMVRARPPPRGVRAPGAAQCVCPAVNCTLAHPTLPFPGCARTPRPRASRAALRVLHVKQPPHQGQAGGAAHAAPVAAAASRGGRRH
jgi:hypothetical protein